MTRTVLLIALTLGLAAGSCSALGGDELTPALLLTGGFLLGFSSPHRAWRWGLMVGVCVPVAWLALQALARTSPPSEVRAFGELASPLPAFLGAYAGVLLRWIGDHLGTGKVPPG